MTVHNRYQNRQSVETGQENREQRRQCRQWHPSIIELGTQVKVPTEAGECECGAGAGARASCKPQEHPLPSHSSPGGLRPLRLIGHVWFYSGQANVPECEDSAAGGGIPDCAHAVEETRPGFSAAPAPRRFMSKRPGPPAAGSLNRLLRAQRVLSMKHGGCSAVGVAGRAYADLFQDTTRGSASALACNSFFCC
jgi:hypothetical protein